MAQVLESPEARAAKKPQTTDRPPVPETDLEHGLTSAEAEKRLAQYGENSLIEHHISALERLL
jgi:H+-transporting ATPase